MRLIILNRPEDVSEWAALFVKKKILGFNPSTDNLFKLGLPTGSTPLDMYQRLIEYHKSGQLSFKHVVTFNMDEYVGLPRNHSQSYHSFMFHNFFKVALIGPV